MDVRFRSSYLARLTSSLFVLKLPDLYRTGFNFKMFLQKDDVFFASFGRTLVKLSPP